MPTHTHTFTLTDGRQLEVVVEEHTDLVQVEVFAVVDTAAAEVKTTMMLGYFPRQSWNQE